MDDFFKICSFQLAGFLIESSMKSPFCHEKEDSTGEFSTSRVSSVELNLDTRAATANEILRDVLGVPVTLPHWAEDELESITSKLNIQSITHEALASLRQDLFDAGLGEYFPEALKMAADRQK